MGILKRQSVRLMRESWNDANELAEELRAIFNSDEPIVIDSPVTLDPPQGSTPLTINNNGADLPAITINNSPDPGIQFPDFPPITIGDLDLSTTQVLGSGDVTTGPDKNNQSPVNIKQTGGGGGIPGQIDSGSGDTYQVRIYPNGLADPSSLVQVKQLQIDPTDAIPVGTWTIVTKITSKDGKSTFYYMQVPVWA